jgi:hypothetical protein
VTYVASYRQVPKTVSLRAWSRFVSSCAGELRWKNDNSLSCIRALQALTRAARRDKHLPSLKKMTRLALQKYGLVKSTECYRRLNSGLHGTRSLKALWFQTTCCPTGALLLVSFHRSVTQVFNALYAKDQLNLGLRQMPECRLLLGPV